VKLSINKSNRFYSAYFLVAEKMRSQGRLPIQRRDLAIRRAAQKKAEFAAVHAVNPASWPYGATCTARLIFLNPRRRVLRLDGRLLRPGSIT
jgi:hypothetical protein